MLAGLFQQSCRLKGLKPLNFRHQNVFGERLGRAFRVFALVATREFLQTQ